MNSLSTWLCLGTLFVPTAMGVGLALVLRRRLGRWAYLAGYFLPLVVLVALYAFYLAMVRAKPCEPAGSLACGETTGYALVIFLAFAALTIVLGAIAQLVLVFIFRARHAQP